MNAHDSLLKVAEAAGLLGVSEVTIRQWVRRYSLPAYKVDGRLYLLESALLDCDAARRNSPRGRPRR